MIEDLKRQLAACEKQAKADKQTVADLRKQLEALLLQQRNDATADAKRVADLREVRVYMYSQAHDRGASFPCRRMARRTTSQGLRSFHCHLCHLISCMHMSSTLCCTCAMCR